MILDVALIEIPFIFKIRIIDRKTGEDLTKKYLIRKFNTKTKYCEYLHRGRTIDHEEEYHKRKLKNARVIVLASKDKAREWLEWIANRDIESLINRDIEIVIDGPNALDIYIKNLPNEKPFTLLAKVYPETKETFA